MVNELKGCPFCGTGEARPFRDTDEYGRVGYGIQCIGSTCSIIGPQFETPEEAITAWNTRADTARLSELEAETARLQRHLQFISKEAALANDVIRLGREWDGQGRIKVATAMHRIAAKARAALRSQS